MGVNTGLLNETVKEIRDGLFKWDQGVWVSSNPMAPGLSPDGFENECGTSYCFAGRVASRKREVLYSQDPRSNRYLATAWMIALEDDSAWTEEILSSTHYRAVPVNGVVEFHEYQGRIILAEHAAVLDLGINEAAADDLFSATNDLEDIENLVTEIIEDGDLYGDILDYEDGY
jgi:hypothetical protein